MTTPAAMAAVLGPSSFLSLFDDCEVGVLVNVSTACSPELVLDEDPLVWVVVELLLLLVVVELLEVSLE